MPWSGVTDSKGGSVSTGHESGVHGAKSDGQDAHVGARTNSTGRGVIEAFNDGYGGKNLGAALRAHQSAYRDTGNRKSSPSKGNAKIWEVDDQRANITGASNSDPRENI